MARKEILKDIRFFNQNGHEVHYLIDHNSSSDDGNDNFYPCIYTHLVETKALHPKNDALDMICIIFDWKSPKALFNVFDSFGEGKNSNNTRKWQDPPMVVKEKFMKANTLKLKPIVKKLTIRYPLWTLL